MLKLFAGQGVEKRLPMDAFPIGEGVIGDVASTGRPFFFAPKDAAASDARLPLATIPLKMNGLTMGVVVIYRLLPHKTGLTPVDQRLLGLIAEHAPAALLSAHLHKTKSRGEPGRRSNESAGG